MAELGRPTIVSDTVTGKIMSFNIVSEPKAARLCGSFPNQHGQCQSPLCFLRVPCWLEPYLSIRGYRAQIIWVRVGGNHRRSFLKKSSYPHRDKCGSMPQTDHLRIAYELVDAP